LGEAARPTQKVGQILLSQRVHAAVEADADTTRSAT
jgi:hypothetical protein